MRREERGHEVGVEEEVEAFVEAVEAEGFGKFIICHRTRSSVATASSKEECPAVISPVPSWMILPSFSFTL